MKDTIIDITSASFKLFSMSGLERMVGPVDFIVNGKISIG
jgi:hypothetical protein